MLNAITAVKGIRVGHDTDLKNATGCTVILCPPRGAVAGVEVRGPAPATRETDLLRAGHLVERVHAVLLTGGSAFGLDAAGGVMRYLEERNIGFDTGVMRVPIVPAAAIFDLALGKSNTRPNAESGYRACRAAASGAVAEGNVGVGTGATVGHLRGMRWATKGGLGTTCRRLAGDIVVGALVVVNAFGDVVDPGTGEILAGTRNPKGGWVNSAQAIEAGTVPRVRSGWQRQRRNTTIGVVATNAALTKEQANIAAMMAHDGLARVCRPAHTLYDGDALFMLSVGACQSDINVIGHVAAEVVAEAVVRAVAAARALCGIPARRDWWAIVANGQ